MPNKTEMVIFTQTFDLLKWLLPHCDDFPKNQRFGVTQRLQGAAMDFAEALYAANAHSGEARLASLRTADAHLNTLRLYLRLTHDWAWLKHNQYEYVSKRVTEIGKLLGGWIRQSKGRAARDSDDQARPAG